MIRFRIPACLCRALILIAVLAIGFTTTALADTVTLTHNNDPVLYEDGSQGSITFTLSNTTGVAIQVGFSQSTFVGCDFGDCSDSFSSSFATGDCFSGWNGLGSCSLETITLKTDNSPVEADTDFALWEIDWAAGYYLASDPQKNIIGTLRDSAGVRVNDGATPVPEPASWLLLASALAVAIQLKRHGATARS